MSEESYSQKLARLLGLDDRGLLCLRCKHRLPPNDKGWGVSPGGIKVNIPPARCACALGDKYSTWNRRVMEAERTGECDDFEPVR